MFCVAKQATFAKISSIRSNYKNNHNNNNNNNNNDDDDEEMVRMLLRSEIDMKILFVGKVVGCKMMNVEYSFVVSDVELLADRMFAVGSGNKNNNTATPKEKKNKLKSTPSSTTTPTTPVNNNMQKSSTKESLTPTTPVSITKLSSSSTPNSPLTATTTAITTDETTNNQLQFVSLFDITEIIINFNNTNNSNNNNNNNNNNTTNNDASNAFDHIGGLSSTITEIVDAASLVLFNSKLFFDHNLDIPGGIILYGPPGTGKTIVAKAIANHLKISFFPITVADVTGKYLGESEDRLRSIFHKAWQNKSPSIIFIDEIDVLAPTVMSNIQTSSELSMETRLVSTLISLLDANAKNSAKQSKQICLIIAATNRIESIDPALRRPGRFEKEIEIGIPNTRQRLDILITLLNQMKISKSNNDNVENDKTSLKFDFEVSDKNPSLNEIASKCHGYVGADLASLCRHGYLRYLQRLSNNNNNNNNNNDDDDNDTSILMRIQDLSQALKDVTPSAMRELVVDVPKVYWSDIGGQSQAKQQLKEAVEWPLKHPEAFIRLGISPPRGVLLYGPPGCSKTLMAKALATESGLNFIAVKGPELLSKWVGASEKAVRDLFRKARAAAPSIVFLDEIDALAPQRSGSGSGNSGTDRVVAQLLQELDGIHSRNGVVTIAATNRPDSVERALLRPGRFDSLVYVAPPEYESRLEILKIGSKSMPLGEDVSMIELAERTERFSGAELIGLCKEAALSALVESAQLKFVYKRHFEIALKACKPQITTSMLKYYENCKNNIFSK